MRFEQLKYFDAAIRFGSLRAAATKMGVAQPSLTQQIRRLEEELDVTLLIRRPTGVIPTDAGLSLLPYVRLALQAEDGLHQEASAISGLHTGRLRLGILPLAGRTFIPAVVRQFRLAYPRVHFEVTETGSGDVRDAMLAGELDLGVMSQWKHNNKHDNSLRFEELFEGRVDVCVPRGHRLESRTSLLSSDLAGEAFVVLRKGHLLREEFDRIAETTDVSAVYTTNSSDSARRIVDAGVGISLHSSLAETLGEQSDYQNSVAIPFVEPWAKSSMGIVRRLHEQSTPAMKVFLRLLRAEAARFSPDKIRAGRPSDSEDLSPIQ